MPFVAPQFDSGGDAGQAFNAGQNSGMSMMERAQQMQQRGAQEERQKAIYEAGLPIVQAKQQADLAVAHATMASFQKAQGLRAKAANTLDSANAEFMAAQEIPDMETKGNVLSQLQGKYAWMEDTPEGKPFVDALNTARVRADDHFVKDATLKNAVAIAKQNAVSREDISADRDALARDLEASKATHAKEIESMKLEMEGLKLKSKQAPNDPQALNEKAAQLDALAQSEDDLAQKQMLETSAKQYRDRAIRVTKPIESSGDAFLQWATGGKPSPATTPNPSSTTKKPATIPDFKSLF